ncbi:MAG: phosphoribosyl-ATP diphosphatase [Gammaproteobacteria bacterium]
MKSAEVLSALAQILQERKQADPEQSYVASLYAGGVDAIAAKISEEAEETIDAAKTGDEQHIIHETADLWFHCLVLLSHLDIPPEQVLAELQRRSGTSGHEEKARRGQ